MDREATDFRTAVAYDCGYQAALDMVERQLSAVQYDPAPYTAMMARLRAMRGDHSPTATPAAIKSSAS